MEVKLDYGAIMSTIENLGIQSFYAVTDDRQLYSKLRELFSELPNVTPLIVSKGFLPIKEQGTIYIVPCADFEKPVKLTYR